MPTPPYARLGIRVNGGAPQYGGITVANGDMVQFVAESTAHWGSPAAIWTIYEYPDGWAGPGAPWVTTVVPQPNGLPDATVFVYAGNSFPPAFAVPAAPLWGKFLPSLLVNGGVSQTVPRDTLYDESTAFQVLSPLGFGDVAFRETSQWGSWRGWNGPLKEFLRAADTAIAAAGALSDATPAAIGTATPGVSVAASRGDHVHAVDENLVFPATGTTDIAKAQAAAVGLLTTLRGQQGAVGSAGGTLEIGPGSGGTPDVDSPGGLTVNLQSDGVASGVVTYTAGALGTFLTVSYDSATTAVSESTAQPILLRNAATEQRLQIGGLDKAILTTSSLALQGIGMVGDYFATSSVGVALSGALRGATNAPLVVFRESGGLYDISAVASGGDNRSYIGDESGDGTTLRAGAGKAVRVEIDGAAVYLRVSETSVGFLEELTVLDATTLTLDAAQSLYIDTHQAVSLMAGLLTFGSDSEGGLDLRIDGGNDVRVLVSSVPVLTVGGNYVTVGGDFSSSGTNSAAFQASFTLKTGTRGASTLRDALEGGYVTTTDASTATAYEAALNNNSIATYEFDVEARDPATGDSAGYKRQVRVKRHGGGAATIVGTGPRTLGVDDADAGAAGWTVAVDVSGNNVRVRVTGALGVTVKWYVSAKVVEMVP